MSGCNFDYKDEGIVRRMANRCGQILGLIFPLTEEVSQPADKKAELKKDSPTGATPRKTICHDCHLIFPGRETICPNCQKSTKTLGAINSPAFYEPEYVEWTPNSSEVSDALFIRRRPRFPRGSSLPRPPWNEDEEAEMKERYP